MDDVDDADLGRRCRAVYIAARAGEVDRTAVFDLAVTWLEDGSRDFGAAEDLAALSAGYAEPRAGTLAQEVLRLLAAAGFCPGFAEEPGWLVRLEDAMRVVNRDVAATGLDPCLLRVRDDEPDGYGSANGFGNAYAETADGYTGIAQGVYPASGASPLSALVDVAEDAQDALNHALFAAWPVCPAHRLGVHARAVAEAAVWWCAGGGGHAVAAIGQWPAQPGPARPSPARPSPA